MATPKKKKIRKSTKTSRKQTTLSTNGSKSTRAKAAKVPGTNTGKTKQEHEQDKIKKIKRINERRAEIERAVQKKQLPKEFLDQYEAAMRSAIHNNDLFSSKGNISHSKDALNKINEKTLDTLLKKETAGKAKKDTYKYYKNYVQEQEREQKTAWERVEQGEDVDENDYQGGYSYNDFVDDRDYVYDNMTSDPDWYNSMKASFQGVGGKKSYSQLRAANERWNAATQQEKDELMKEAVKREYAAYFG